MTIKDELRVDVRLRPDAKLAKAAPALLAACKSAKALLEYCEMDDMAQWRRLRDAIQEAE